MRLQTIVVHAVRTAGLTLAMCAPALSQTALPPVADTVSLSGPRFGFTVLSDGVVKTLKTEGVSVGPALTQFGWQVEKQFYNGPNGPTAVTEAVLLFGGLEQGLALPSLSWLAGVRTKNGTEFGVGPNLTAVGVALVVSAGMTFRAGVMNVPVNVAVVPSRAGVRVTLLSGFNMRR
jgi:hypothetical protein